MAKHAEILRPHFELVQRKLEAGLGELGVATWTRPRGGYFVSFDGPVGSAKAIVSLMAELGVTLTGAGATWPYGNDPYDSNIRIAPTFPTIEELGAALDVFVLAVKLVSARLARG
jgi:DNA-binding transcriptional MocR family regulator